MEDFGKHKKGCTGIKPVVFGLLVITAGVVLMLRNMELIDPFYASVIISWPMLIVAFGFLNLFGKEFPFGAILILVGGALLGSKFFDLPINISQMIWPAVIILFGLIVIAGSRFVLKGGWKSSKVKDGNLIEEVNVFSGGEHIVTAPEFKGGSFICVFGGSKVNLLQTQLHPAGATVEVVALFGGLELLIPGDWNVKTEVVSVFGGFADKRILTATSPDRNLVVKGVCIFGGGTIKSIPD